MRDRIRGADAAWAAVRTTERLPVALQPTDLIGPVQPSEAARNRPPRVRKPSRSHDVVYAPTQDLAGHKAHLREAFGSCSNEFTDVMVGKLISGLRPTPHDILEEATLNAAIAVVAAYKPTTEAEGLIATQIAIAGFSSFRMMELSQRHLNEVNIGVYGGFANKLLKIQNELIHTLDRRRRGNSQTVNVRHVHIHQGDRGVVGVIAGGKGDTGAGDEN